MRLKQLELIKYGKFDGGLVQLPRARADFHVIVGPNEAGKSTVRSAVVELLFGMPTRTALSFLHDVSELRLGGIVEAEDVETVFHRARGRTQLRTPQDERLPDDLLAQSLDGISKEFYEQMFSLDHQRLLEGGRSILNASDRLGQVLFESAAGVGSLGPMREQLDDLASNLWAPRRSQSEYAQAESRLTDATAELKGAQVRTKVWVEARDSLREVNDEIEKVKAEQIRLETLRSKLERVRRLAPFLQELASKQTELEDLGDVTELPASAYDELVQCRSEIAVAKRVVEERESDLLARQAERDALTTDDAAIASAADIEELERMRGAFVNHPRDLPLRHAERNGLLAAAFDAAAQLGWPTELEALQAALPKSLALKTVTNLLREHGALDQALRSAQESLEEKSGDLEALQTQLAELTQTEVPAEFRGALSEAQGLKNSAVTEATATRAVTTGERLLRDALLALGQWKLPVEELRTLALPSVACVSAIERDEAERASAVTNARDALAQAEEKAAELTLEERQFSAGTKVVTTADVLAERGRRDSAWADIKDGVVPLTQAASGLDAAIRLADELVDAQLGTTQSAANLQALRHRLEAATADIERRTAALSAREAELNELRVQWDASVVAAGVPGMPLADFAAWSAKRDEALSAHEALEQRRAELADVRQARSDATAHLEEALRAASVTFAPSELQTLVALAESFSLEAAGAQAKQESLDKQTLLAERAKLTAQAKLDRAKQAYDLWKSQWEAALAVANLAEHATTHAEAESAIDLVGAITRHLAAAEELQLKRIEAMEDDLRSLASLARRISESIAAELATMEDSLEVTRRLTRRLSAAKEAAGAVARADEALRSAKAKKTEAETSASLVEARTVPLLASAGVDSIDEALPIAERSDKKRELNEALERARTSLIRDGDGLTQEQLSSEIAEYNLSEVPALLEEVKRDLTAANDKRSTVSQTQVTARQEFDAMNGRANAAVAEAKRQEALSTMGEVAEQYLEAATAARLLKWATDRYRDQKQGPMLKRAGEIFAGLTLGHFTKLSVNAEANPPSLYAKRGNGASVEVSGLSEGTRDQLFLSLRIAALELQLRHKKPLPFIADDLFINFDDVRAKAGLEALRELSRSTQVLFLTHHDHLLSLVTEVFGADVNVVRLMREATQA